MIATPVSFCKKTGLNTRYCPHCKQTRDRKTMSDKILEVLQDHEVHGTRGIAERTGLLDEDGRYPDIQRAIRLLRAEGHPIKCIDASASTYRLLNAEEAPDFWRQYERPKTKEVADLESKVASLEAEIAKLREENKFMADYCAERDAQIQSLSASN